jgi:hypothetical protein
MLLRAEFAISAVPMRWSGLILHNDSKLQCYVGVKLRPSIEGKIIR